MLCKQKNRAIAPFQNHSNDSQGKCAYLMQSPCIISIAQKPRNMQGNTSERRIKTAKMQVIYENHEKWLNGRLKGIGGSDASAIVGCNPYKSNIDLWEEKTGMKAPEDISNKSYIKYGHDAEPLLVKLFALDYPQYEVNYNDNFRVNYNDEHNFIFCTRDCDLFEKANGIKGALEIKTTELLNSMQKEKWNDQIPSNYYCQILQYFITDKELQFVWVKAQIKSDFGDGKIVLKTKHYYFTREQCQDDIEWLKNQEIDFWNKYVLKGVRPNRLLPNI